MKVRSIRRRGRRRLESIVSVYVADDQQLRDLTFCGLGSLAGASWVKVAAAAPIIFAGLALAPFLARGLNGLALGKAAAHHMGLPVQRWRTPRS